jgi:hypothetical protein
MMKALPIQDLTFLGVNPTPAAVVQSETFQACAAALGRGLDVRPSLEGGAPLAGPNLIAKSRFALDSRQYEQLRTDMLAILAAHGTSTDDYLAEA